MYERNATAESGKKKKGKGIPETRSWYYEECSFWGEKKGKKMTASAVLWLSGGLCRVSDSPSK